MKHLSALKRNLSENKKGSALLIALVIMMVVTMLSLALLLVSYSLFASSNKQNNVQQCRALAQSLSRELEAEITIPQFDSYEAQMKAMDSGEYPLWFYLRFNVAQSGWPYYNVDERGHGASYACRYFKVEPDSLSDGDGISLMDDISVLMYWESESGADKNDISLVISVTCQKGKQSAVITTTYNLVTGDNNYTDYVADGTEDNNGQVLIDSTYNPQGNKIYPGEIWNWGFSERE